MMTRKIIPGSERAAPKAAIAGEVNLNDQGEVSIYLKRPSARTDLSALHSRADMRQSREAALTPAMDRLEAFATEHGLTVSCRDPGRRLVKLSGSLHDLQEAFNTRLHMFAHAAGRFRGRSGPLSAPAAVVDDIEAVLGLDQRPVATPKSRRILSANVQDGYLPSDVAKLYDFPTTAKGGAGQTIALIELGGGVSSRDTSASFKAMALPPPKVTAIAVDGASHKAGRDTHSDGEVALDVQVAGGAAPKAHIAVYFAPNTDQGFVDAITQATHDETLRPSVMSISWGSAESGWTQQAVTTMNSAFQDAVELGLSVFAAAGDGLATDGQTDGKAHVDFPASSPWVVGCGGTKLTGAPGATPESVWNSQGGGTGGGISDLFAVPTFQSAIQLPTSVNPGGRQGRGVPDVSGDADPQTGYRVVVDGQPQLIGGTSAVAPLWAGLFALVNELAGKPVGLPLPTLYAHPEAFNDVRLGDNREGGLGYGAEQGWDACTGLGTPKGSAVAALFS